MSGPCEFWEPGARCGRPGEAFAMRWRDKEPRALRLCGPHARDVEDSLRLDESMDSLTDDEEAAWEVMER